MVIIWSYGDYDKNDNYNDNHENLTKNDEDLDEMIRKDKRMSLLSHREGVNLQIKVKIVVFHYCKIL